METAIQVRDLKKVYHVGQNSIAALDGIDLEIQRGEFVCIVGRSGSGKSTLLNMMAGLERPSKGGVVIAGKHIEKLSEAQLVRFRLEHVGFIFQSFNLFPALTAEENVAVPLTYRGIGRRKRLKQSREMLTQVGLQTHLKHRPTQMSGGQQQRVGIARALVANPAIIFADEPTGNLDSKTSAEVLDLMRSVVGAKGHTLVLVTHDPEVARWGDRVVHILDGRITSIEVNPRPGAGEETPPDAVPPEQLKQTQGCTADRAVEAIRGIENAENGAEASRGNQT